MALGLVQQSQVAWGTGGTQSNPFPGLAAPTSGNMIVVYAELNDNNPSMGGTGVTYTRHYFFSGDASHDNCALWTGVVAGGASSTQTLTQAAAINNGSAIFAEFSGVQQVVDGTPPTATNVSSATPSVTSNTPSVAGDLAVAFCGQASAIAPTATPSTWTTLTAAASSRRVDGAWLDLAGSSAAVTPQWTFAASKFALLGIVLIKATAGAAAVVVPPAVVVDSAVDRSANY